MNTTKTITASKNPIKAKFVETPVNIPITTLISVSIAITFILPPNSENKINSKNLTINPIEGGKFEYDHAFRRRVA